LKITVLVENTATDGFLCEHGLSLLIEKDNKKYLLDAGQSRMFMDNATVLNADIERVEYAVLSHGHYDHSGGFFEYLNKYPDIKVHAMETAFGDYYSSKGGMHEIGIPANIKEGHREAFCLHTEATELSEGVFLVPHNTEGLCAIGEKAGLFAMKEDKIVPDDFCHEASLVIDSGDGLVIFNSCSHGGVSNIINEVKMALPNQRIKAFVGGLHMIGMKDGVEICTFSDEEIIELVNVLKSEGVEKIYTGHCTGKVGFDKIKKCFGETKTVALYSGAEISI
jgi:7,8-dihydropterin-6-yl-methyl-4-(beta-D-ribofuranosyl)aminobenzene 5'-phosphate synthase